MCIFQLSHNSFNLNFPCSPEQREAWENNWAENFADWRGGGKWLGGILHSQKHFNCCVFFLWNPGAHERLWTTSLIVLRAFLWYSCICQNTICCTNSTVSHREKNTILMRKVQPAFRNAVFCFVVSQEQNPQRWAQQLKSLYYSPWFCWSGSSSRSMKV